MSGCTAAQLPLPLPVGSPAVTKPSAEGATDRPLLMSLRPRFAQAVLDGSKTVELRRTRVSAPPGTIIIIYASAPVMSVVGIAQLDAVDTDTPARLWRCYRKQLGLSRAEFDEYLIGTDTASCLTITSPQTLSTPYALSWLRDYTHFQPPQSYRYLAQHDPEPLHTLVKGNA
jgi:predicted transcriptional regulator